MLQDLIPQDIFNEIKSYIDKFVLTEASDVSLHQMYDKIYGEGLISMLLELDPSKKKKFAEWVLKALKNEGKDQPAYLHSYLHNTTHNHLKKLAKGFLEDGFQLYTYKDIPTAYQALLKIEDAKEYDRIKPVYNDGTIEIYKPTSSEELRDLLINKFRKKEVETDSPWCVGRSGNEGQRYWTTYTSQNEYNIYLVYNASQKKLYLWNDNPNKSRYSDKLYFYDFNNWGNTPCNPIKDGGLTEGAVEFLDSQSDGKMTKVIKNVKTNKTPLNLNLPFNELVEECLRRLGEGTELEEVFDEVAESGERDIAKIKLRFKYNFINTENNLLLSPNQWFDYARNFIDGWAEVQITNKENLINTDGNLLWNRPVEEWFGYIDINHSTNGYFTCGLNRKYNFVNVDEEFLWNRPVEEWFDYCSPIFNGNYSIVTLNNKINVINIMDGKFLFPPNFRIDSASVFYDKQIKIQIKNKENIFDIEKNDYLWNKPFEDWFDCIGEYIENNLIKVQFKKKWYLFDLNNGNLCDMKTKQPTHYVDSRGNIVYPNQTNETFFRDYSKILSETLHKLLLTEASDVSLHQMYDKIFGAEVVTKLLELDPSKKKKFAEWVLKALRNNGGEEGSLHDLLPLKRLEKLSKAFLEDGFQLYTYKDIPTAYQELLKIEDAKEYDRIKPVYNDGTIEIYKPTSSEELRDLLINKFRKKEVETDSPWCVARSGNEGQRFWDTYTSQNSYSIYLIYNVSQNKLYLWNDNPNQSRYGINKPYYCDFNNWGNVPCNPIKEGGLTQGAVEFLDSQSEGRMTQLITGDIKIKEEDFEQRVEECLRRVREGADIRVVFDGARYLRAEGFALVALQGKKNILNTVDYTLLSPNQWFSRIEDFIDGWSRVSTDNNKCNLLNTEGKFMWDKPIEQWFDWMYDELDDNKNVKVSINDKYNLLNVNGDLVWNKPAMEWFDSITRTSELINYKVKIDNKINFLNKNGNLLSPDIWFAHASKESEKGYRQVELDNCKVNLMDIYGNFLSSDFLFDFVDIKSSENGYFRCELDGQWNYVTFDEKLLSPYFWFDECSNYFYGNYGVVKSKGKMNLINMTDGKLAFPNDWLDGISGYYNNCVSVIKKNKENIFNIKKGELLWKKPIEDWFEKIGGLDGMGNITVLFKKKWCLFNLTNGNLYDIRTRQPMHYVDSRGNIVYPNQTNEAFFRDYSKILSETLHRNLLRYI